MLRQKRFLIFLFLLFAMAALAGYLYTEQAELKDELAALRQENLRRDRRLEAYDNLLAADATFHEGRYERAIAAYQRIDTLPQVAARIDHARRLLQQRATLDDLRVLSGRQRAPIASISEAPAAAPVERMPLTKSNPSQYDSLTFALRKANMQIRNLRGQLTRGSSDYLTFESRKGNETFYVGDTRKGMANGRGVALLSSGSRYIGEWQDNRKHGAGTFHWQDGAYYEGEYEDDKRSGQGTYHFPSGEVFVGSWEDDVRDGQGVFYDKNGEVVAKGVWREDELVEER